MLPKVSSYYNGILIILRKEIKIKDIPANISVFLFPNQIKPDSFKKYKTLTQWFPTIYWPNPAQTSVKSLSRP